MNQMIYNTLSGEARAVPQVQAEHMARNSYGEWSLKKPRPPGWNKEIPKYRISIDLHPSPLARHRHETPIVFSTDSSLWQYCEKPVSAGEIVETTSWPHLSMQPLNDSAIAVRDYLRDHMKSRLPMSPWRNGRLWLDDGLSAAPPQRSDLRPPSMPSLVKPIRVAR
jgi:hypothetical protein